jgi:hypothetical protein
MSLVLIGDLSDPRWTQLWSRDALQHAQYTPSALEVGARHYTRAYYLPEEADVSQSRRCATDFIPHHALVLGADGPVAGVALTVEILEGRTRLSAYGRPIYLVEDRSAPGRIRKQAAELIFRHLEAVRAEYCAERWHARDTLLDGIPSPLTELTLRNGGISRHQLVRMVDLEPDEEVLRSDLRKTYRNILKRPPLGLRLNVLTAGEITHHDLDQFSKLEVEYHGQAVVEDEVWDAILKSARNGEAFLVTADLDGHVVSMGYFAASLRHAAYVAGVNNQARIGAGLSHHVIWHAIRHARSLGCKHFELGELIFPGDHPTLEEKILGISRFKAGFGSRAVCRLDIFSAPLN